MSIYNSVEKLKSHMCCIRNSMESISHAFGLSIKKKVLSQESTNLRKKYYKVFENHLQFAKKKGETVWSFGIMTNVDSYKLMHNQYTKTAKFICYDSMKNDQLSNLEYDEQIYNEVLAYMIIIGMTIETYYILDSDTLILHVNCSW